MNFEAKLMPLLDALPRMEKYQLLQFLVTSITKDEKITPLDSTVTYPMWNTIQYAARNRYCASGHACRGSQWQLSLYDTEQTFEVQLR